MKKKSLILIPIFILFLIVIIFATFTFRIGPIVETIKERYNIEYKFVPTDSKWKININDEYKITAEKIEKDRSFLVSWFSNPENIDKNLNDDNFKDIHLENTLNQNLIIIQALKEKMLDKEDFDRFIWITIRDAIVQYYLTKKLKKEKPDILKINADNKEVNDVYEKYFKNYSIPGLSRDETIAQIRETMLNQKKSIVLRAFENNILNKLKLNNKIEFAK